MEAGALVAASPCYLLRKDHLMRQMAPRRGQSTQGTETSACGPLRTTITRGPRAMDTGLSPCNGATAPMGFSSGDFRVTSCEGLPHQIDFEGGADGFQRTLRNSPAMADADTFGDVVHPAKMTVSRDGLACWTARSSEPKRRAVLALAILGLSLEHEERGSAATLRAGRNTLEGTRIHSGNRASDDREPFGRFTRNLPCEDSNRRGSSHGGKATSLRDWVLCAKAPSKGPQRALHKLGTDINIPPASRPGTHPRGKPNCPPPPCQRAQRRSQANKRPH